MREEIDEEGEIEAVVLEQEEIETLCEGVSFSLSRPRGQKRYERDEAQENYDDVAFQVHCKYRAYGYRSPEEMLENENEMRELLEAGRPKRRPPQEGIRTNGREDAEKRKRLKTLARELVKVKHSDDPHIRVELLNLDNLMRKAVHQMAEKAGVKAQTTERVGKRGLDGGKMLVTKK